MTQRCKFSVAMDERFPDSLPRENREAYAKLFAIETGLRELLIGDLGKLAGPKWHKTRLPSDIYKKYVDGMQFERSIKWAHQVLHHPIYYVDFPDLKKVILRKDNWEQCFKLTFQRAEIFEATVSELEFVRNRVAHNRRCCNSDIVTVQNALNILLESIGTERLMSLISHCTTLEDLPSTLRSIRRELSEGLEKCMSLSGCEIPHLYNSVKESWWFDSDYLGNPIDKILSAEEILLEYCALPRVRGSGYLIERWVGERNIPEVLQQANEQFEFLSGETK